MTEEEKSTLDAVSLKVRMDEERYARGLERLGLWTPGRVCGGHNNPAPDDCPNWRPVTGGREHPMHGVELIDLRRDSAFAWRAWKAVRKHFGIKEEPEELLYRQVCELGKRDEKVE